MKRPDMRAYWSAKRARQEASREQGECTITVTTAGRVRRVNVIAPYNPVFLEKAGALQGKWKPKGRLWSFPITAFSDVYSLCTRVYGNRVRVTGQQRSRIDDTD